jgi:hypothetical protein
MATLLNVLSPHRPPNQSRLQALAYYLPGGWLVNNGGEATDRDPTEIAQFVRNGGKWLDYCGYPMYYREDYYPGGLVKLGGNGFGTFLMSLDNMKFDQTFRSDKHKFRYPRSLVVLSPTVPPWVVAADGVPRTDKIFSMFAIVHPSGGMYMYAYGEGSAGINVYSYINFARQMYGLPPIEPPPESPVLPVLGVGLLLGGAWWLMKESGKR